MDTEDITNKMNEYISELEKAKKEGIGLEQFAGQSALDGNGIEVLENLSAYRCVGADIQDIVEHVGLNDESVVLENLDICRRYDVDMARLIATLVHSDTSEVISKIDLVLANGVEIDELVRLIGEYGDIDELRHHYGELIEYDADQGVLDSYVD